jgi:hypothetical protein
MMFEKIAQYTAAELALAKQVTALEELKNDPELKRELEFNSELETLLLRHSFSKTKLHSFLGAQLGAVQAAETKAPRAAKEKDKDKKYAKHTNKLWSNPHTGETVLSRRRDHKTLLKWTEEHGLEAVMSWMTPTN